MLLTLTPLLSLTVRAEAPLGVGRILIADKDLHDPHFEHTVILLISYDEDAGAGGLILTRPTDTPVSKALHDFTEARDNADPVYEGGPVATRSVLAVLRSKSDIENAERVLPEVYTVGNNKLLRKALKEKMVVRVFAGYAGWGPGQLEDEVDEGAWHVDRANADVIFDDNPENLWHRLTRRLDSQIARATLQYKNAFHSTSRSGSVSSRGLVREDLSAGRNLQGSGAASRTGKSATSWRSAGHDRI
jgi:putative transcriptional regulator